MQTAALPSRTADPSDPRWLAVVSRDPGADGRFVYAVATTGVYCRPVCPARRPRLENVVFFATPGEAEQAGFRPCARCRPKEPPIAARHAALAAAACEEIENASGPLPLKALAEKAGMSPSHLARVFKNVLGVTPKSYAQARRAARLRENLERDQGSLAAIFGAGYGSASRFYESGGAHLGMTPTAYREGGENEAIRFTTGSCELGALLVAATGRGVCAIDLGDDPAALVAGFRKRFPKAVLIEDDAAFSGLVQRIAAFIETPAAGLDLPLDIRGTAFQRRVWGELRKVAPGETQTYAQTAAKLGNPKAVRAVASAVAANPLAVAIPCHRIVREDAKPSGYRWGLERKKRLLKREAAMTGRKADESVSGDDRGD